MTLKCECMEQLTMEHMRYTSCLGGLGMYGYRENERESKRDVGNREGRGSEEEGGERGGYTLVNRKSNNNNI